MVLNSHLDYNVALDLVPCLTKAFLSISPCPLLQIIDLSRVHEEIGLDYDQYSPQVRPTTSVCPRKCKYSKTTQNYSNLAKS